MGKTRILFSIDDFKTQFWGQELKKFNYEIVPNGNRLNSQIAIIISGFFQKKRIHAFIFRYLNDNDSMYESILFFLRDFLTILICKILRVKVLWLVHNIDQETHQYYPRLSRFRRKLVNVSSKQILVTDPHLIEIAESFRINKRKLDWVCFGKPEYPKPDAQNIELREKIILFRESLRLLGCPKTVLGLCVSEPALKKNHYLAASSIVGKSQHPHDCSVGLVLIGKFPKSREFSLAKEKVIESPYVLFIEESFPVDEEYISDQIDFFYRGLTDQSIAYSLYVAADLEKPVVVQNSGALPFIVEKENLGMIIEDDSHDIPGSILESISRWEPENSQMFLSRRSWAIGAERLVNAIENYST